MATSDTTTADVATALADALRSIPDLRVYQWVADQARPPFVLLALPTIDYLDTSTGFCYARWDVPASVVVSRSSDRQAQDDLSKLVTAVVTTLDGWEFADLFSVEPVDARPQGVAVNGQDLPGYLVTIRVRA